MILLFSPKILEFEMDYKEKTEERIRNRRSRSRLDVNTILEDFAIISYKVPINRIEHLIPKPFKLWTFFDNDQEYALISAVPFHDRDFSFPKLIKQVKFSFYQTNFRTYIINEKDNSHAAWFFGTTLGSITSMIPKYIWSMPWRYGKYQFTKNQENSEYLEYKMSFKSSLGNGKIDIKSINKTPPLLEGFKSIEEQIHILTHPVVGYYHLPNLTIGTYEIWHPRIDLKMAKSTHLYFELFEKYGLLDKTEMNKPHSVLITERIEFDILLPPRGLED